MKCRELNTMKVVQLICLFAINGLFLAQAFSKFGINYGKVRYNRFVTRAREEASTGIIRPICSSIGRSWQSARLYMSMSDANPQNPMVST